MKIGDLVEIYRHVPRHESGEIPVGNMGMGVIVDIKESVHRCTPLVSWVTTAGELESTWLGATTGVVVTMKVINEDR